MENASKALIIAGAILLSILIIGLGMAVYNNSTSSSKSANLDTQEIQAHNSQFLSFEGKQKGAQVRSLVTAIRKNNREFTDRMIEITDNHDVTRPNNFNPASIATCDATDSTDPNTDYTTILGNISNGTTYYVSFNESDNGCIGGMEFHIWSSAD